MYPAVRDATMPTWCFTPPGSTAWLLPCLASPRRRQCIPFPGEVDFICGGPPCQVCGAGCSPWRLAHLCHGSCPTQHSSAARSALAVSRQMLPHIFPRLIVWLSGWYLCDCFAMVGSGCRASAATTAMQKQKTSCWTHGEDTGCHRDCSVDCCSLSAGCRCSHSSAHLHLHLTASSPPCPPHRPPSLPRLPPAVCPSCSNRQLAVFIAYSAWFKPKYVLMENVQVYNPGPPQCMHMCV